ncbi:MAG: hypothetical protein QOD62_2302, partial [Actinomycetota bacterium]|nr:hypothetical protein [Actinomycetota bacterium]
SARAAIPDPSDRSSPNSRAQPGKRMNLVPSASMKPSSGPPRIGAEHRDARSLTYAAGRQPRSLPGGSQIPLLARFAPPGSYPAHLRHVHQRLEGNARTTNRPVWKRGLGGPDERKVARCRPKPPKAMTAGTLPCDQMASYAFVNLLRVSAMRSCCARSTHPSSST